jgi:diguanylate cyclase (GGDEF)-like protein/PAS domain S-box-containing protein
LNATQLQPGSRSAESSLPSAEAPALFAPRWLLWSIAGLLLMLFVGIAGNVLFTLAPASAASWFGAYQGEVAMVVKGAHDGAAVLVVLALLLWLVSMGRELVVLRKSSTRLQEGVDALAIGIGMWDADDRLIACNDTFRALYPEIADRFVAGVSYLELVRAYYPVAPAEVIDGRSFERFVGDAERRRNRPPGSDIVRHHRGRWLLMTDVRNASGGLVSFRMDVTEQRVFDVDLRKRRKVLDDLAELTSDWHWRVDAAGRFTEFSPAMQRTLLYRPEDLLGKRIEEIPGFFVDERVRVSLHALFEKREPLPWLTFCARRADGMQVWLALTGRPMFDANQEFLGYFGAARDVSDREASVELLRQSEARFRALTALATEWYWETDADLRLTQLHGPPELEMRRQQVFLGRSLLAIGDDPNYRIDREVVGDHLRRREAFHRLPYRVQRNGGAPPVYYESSAEPMFVDGKFAGYRGLSWDVSDRESTIALLRESEERFRALTELSSDWYWEMDENLRFTSMRQGGTRPLPFEESEMVGRQRWDLPGEPVRPATWEEHRRDLDARRPFRDLIVRRLDSEGKVLYTLTAGDPLFDETNRFRGYRGIGRNITEQVRDQERIERLATMDQLTQLMNRHTFGERAERALSSTYAENRRAALLFLDLDDFRDLNNTYGHLIGDEMLSIVAERMRAVIGEPHLIGRRGGDELVALLLDVANVDAAVEKAQVLIGAVSAPARVRSLEVSVTPSVGIAMFPNDGVDLDSLLKAADAAMYTAKKTPQKRTYSLYTPEVARAANLRTRLEQRLRKAVDTRDFRLYYQPIVSLIDHKMGQMIAAECLIRWKDAELGEISPADFVPIAEESGLIIELGDWVLREACRARQVWRGLGLDLPPLAVNMAGAQLEQINCVDRVLDILGEFSVHPSEIEIEVTETSLFNASPVVRENLRRLRAAQVKLVLDDFGVGYSSLSHLRELDIDRLKIDRSFTEACMKEEKTLVIVKAVIQMARSLKINVTAEGIEKPEQQTWMKYLECDSAQGFLYARPMPADEFLKIFLDRRGVGRERSLMH